MVWMDSPPDIWKTFGLSFSNDEFLNLNISNCLDEIFQFNSGMKLNWDEPGYLDVVEEFLDYPVLKILTYRKDIFEKVISEMLAIQTHDGLYDDANKKYLFSFQPEQKPRTSLPFIVHQADLMAVICPF